MSLRARALVWRGSVEAGALLVPGDAARARLLRWWRPGVVVTGLEGRYLWQWPQPTRLQCDQAPGLPLVRDGAVLLAAPVTADELAALAPAPGSVVTVRDGRLEVLPVPAQTVDVSTWLELGPLELQKVEPLGEPPAAAPAAVSALSPLGLRERLGAPQADPRAAELAAALERLAHPHAGPPPATGVRAPRALTRLLGSLRRAFASWLRRPASERTTPAPAARAPGWLSRLSEAFDRLLARLALESKLSALLGRRQAEYLSRLMDMFDQGDLMAALRHAIPLGGANGPGDSRPALGVPGPRSSLAISPQLGGRSTSLTLQDDLYAQLRERYRRAAKTLEAQGRIEEAAFVLAELLQDSEGAVSLLERHGKLRAAAELAESRQLQPALQVRQWFLAGDVGRALAIARRTGAFADAVLRLERGGKTPEARKLRLLWADTLAGAGDYASAVNVAWSLDDARPLARRWLELGVAQGGPQGARLLAKQLVLEPERGPELSAKVLGLFESNAEEDAASRAALAAALTEQQRTQAERTQWAGLARAGVRALVRDSARSGRRPPAFEALVKLSGDFALRHDLPPASLPQVLLKHRSRPQQLQLGPTDRGAMPVYDAALLPNGTMLLALGEAGARLLTPDGRTSAHFDVPTHALVTCDAGDRALALATRGEATRVSRLNLSARTARTWVETGLSSWADSSDGSMWFVVEDGALVGVDLLAERWRALWRLAAPPAGFGRPARTAAGLAVATLRAPHELWSYELPSLTLRRRFEVPEGGLLGVDAVTPGRALLTRVLGDVLFTELQGVVGEPTRVQGVDGQNDDAVLSDEWAAVVQHQGDQATVSLVDTHQATARLHLRLSGTGEPSRLGLRLQPEVAVVCDGAGRALAIDLATGALRRNLRVR